MPDLPVGESDPTAKHSVECETGAASRWSGQFVCSVCGQMPDATVMTTKECLCCKMQNRPHAVERR